MKLKLGENEGLYYFDHYDYGPPTSQSVVNYIKQNARWVMVKRRYSVYTRYLFIGDTSIETYLALAFGITEESRFEI